MKPIVSEQSTKQPQARPGPFSEPSALESYPDWRCRLANQLAEEAGDAPPTHEDPWIRDMAQLLHASFRNQLFEPSDRQRRILQALQLPKLGVLVQMVLESRLAIGQSPEEIAKQCRIAPEIIGAYAALLCDVTDHRRRQAWFRRRPRIALTANKHISTIALLLLQQVIFGASEGIDSLVAALCNLRAPTLADGLPDRNAPDFFSQLTARAMLAGSMLPMNRKNSELMARLEEAQRDTPSGVLMTEDAVAISLEILQKAKVPKGLLKELQPLREFCRPAEDATSAAEAPGCTTTVSV